MPGGNGTGPMGMGPMTGRGAGYCSATGVPGYAGGGFGRRNRFFAAAPRGRFTRSTAMDAMTEKEALLNQAEALQAQLDAIRKRLDSME